MKFKNVNSKGDNFVVSNLINFFFFFFFFFFFYFYLIGYNTFLWNFVVEMKA
jgi:hypothetical protein